MTYSGWNTLREPVRDGEASLWEEVSTHRVEGTEGRKWCNWSSVAVRGMEVCSTEALDTCRDLMGQSRGMQKNTVYCLVPSLIFTWWLAFTEPNEKLNMDDTILLVMEEAEKSREWIWGKKSKITRLFLDLSRGSVLSLLDSWGIKELIINNLNIWFMTVLKVLGFKK